MNEQEYLKKKQEIARRYMKELEELDKEFNLSLLNLEKVPGSAREEFMDSVLPSVPNLTRKAERALGGYNLLYIDEDFDEYWQANKIPVKNFKENVISVAKLKKLNGVGYATVKFIVQAFIDFGLEVNFYGATWKDPRQRKTMADLEKRQEERKQK